MYSALSCGGLLTSAGKHSALSMHGHFAGAAGPHTQAPSICRWQSCRPSQSALICFSTLSAGTGALDDPAMHAVTAPGPPREPETAVLGCQAPRKLRPRTKADDIKPIYYEER